MNIHDFVTDKIDKLELDLRDKIRRKQMLETQIEILELEKSDWVQLRMEISNETERSN